jgi:hypothetical protein
METYTKHEMHYSTQDQDQYQDIEVQKPTSVGH